MTKASTLDPKNNLAHHHLGQVHKLRGEWEPALAEFRRAHELNPNHPRTHVDLAIVVTGVYKLVTGRNPGAKARH